MDTLNFTALDFETATPDHHSICQVGLVVVTNGIISRKYCCLIQPPGNEYYFHNIKVHKIEPNMTSFAPYFPDVWKDISKYIENQHIVCHNAEFDLLKLEKTLIYYGITLPELTYSCTMSIFGGSLVNCCKEQDIDFFSHHDALSDAEACAKLYLKYMNYENISNENNNPYSFKKIEKDDLVPDFNIENKDNPFYQKKIVFTGDLVNFSRTEAAHRVKLLGADVNTAISRKTDFVILGRNPGPSKLTKINELNIPIISEDEFLNMLA
jgi:DNA polymerase III subunit epsilon